MEVTNCIPIKEIIENHKHFVDKDCDGWENMAARLSYAFLSNMDLHGADLREVDLSHANLVNANLREANLTNAYLHGANLYGADLSGANLHGAGLCEANIAYANLSNADLSGANMAYVNLRGSDLSNADLLNTNLVYAILSGAYLDDAKGPLIEYRKGKILTEDIIGYKKCRNDVIVILKIPKDSTVFSINGTKCRTNKAEVVAINNGDIAYSMYDNTSYHVGDKITIHNFNCEYNVECAEGIHFFMTREEALLL